MISREELLRFLAEYMRQEARNDDAEPYRQAGDRLVDEALELID